MRRETQHVLLGLLGGALIRIAADDTYLRYVRPSHRWLLIAAGTVMVVLAVVALVRDLRGRSAGGTHDGDHNHNGDDHGSHDHHSHDHHSHDHPTAERQVAWLLLAPVLVITLVAPPALGADAVTRAGARNAVVQDSDVFAALPPGPAPELAVGDFVQRAAWDSSGSLDGREVTLTGFAVRRGAAVELARLTIACCAADARPHRVRLVGDVVAEPDTWLRVRGTLQPGSATPATGYVPALTVRSVELVPAPPDPYEF